MIVNGKLLMLFNEIPSTLMRKLLKGFLWMNAQDKILQPLHE